MVYIDVDRIPIDIGPYSLNLPLSGFSKATFVLNGTNKTVRTYCTNGVELQTNTLRTNIKNKGPLGLFVIEAFSLPRDEYDRHICIEKLKEIYPEITINRAMVYALCREINLDHLHDGIHIGDMILTLREHLSITDDIKETESINFLSNSEQFEYIAKVDAKNEDLVTQNKILSDKINSLVDNDDFIRDHNGNVKMSLDRDLHYIKNFSTVSHLLSNDELSRLNQTQTVSANAKKLEMELELLEAKKVAAEIDISAKETSQEYASRRDTMSLVNTILTL